MKYIRESIGFTPKILKKNFSLKQKVIKREKKQKKNFPSVTRRRRHGQNIFTRLQPTDHKT
jgi:hypothetical protein